MAGTVAAALLPDPRFRSNTAAPGNSDLQDQNVYSALVVAHGGGGTQQIFSVPIGGAIPSMTGSAATANKHQTVYSLATTNIEKAGEFGNTLGDASVRAIGMQLEPAAIVLGTGAPRSFGATQFETADCMSKLTFEFKVGGKRQNSGAFSMYPEFGGLTGSVSTTGNAATASIAGNGAPGSMRRLKYPILIGRTDTVAAIFGTSNGSTLAFSNTANDGQPCLLWVNLHCTLAGDIR